jgi:hypothetical protein
MVREEVASVDGEGHRQISVSGVPLKSVEPVKGSYMIMYGESKQKERS